MVVILDVTCQYWYRYGTYLSSDLLMFFKVGCEMLPAVMTPVTSYPVFDVSGSECDMSIQE
jgi:hypothetical protein